MPELNASEYIYMRFSPDSKTLLSLSGGPDFTMVNWLWEKIKPQQILKLGGGGGYDCDIKLLMS